MSLLLSTLHGSFHERSSHLFGRITRYAPDAPPSEWGDLAWVITTEKSGRRGEDGPISVQIKAEYVMEVFNRPGFVAKKMLWESPQGAN